MNARLFLRLNMKKIVFLALTIFLAGALWPVSALAVEKIDSFDVDIKINQDASLNVSEEIKYDFGNAQKHGIFRTIPIKYKARGGNYNLRLSDIKVTDEKGVSYNFQKSFPGNNIEIKIGDSDKFVTGEKTYVINYKIKRAINYFENQDELYWNVTGNEWPVSIEKASALIILPEAVSVGSLQLKCFAGSYGSSAGCSGGDGLVNGNNINFSQSKLSAGEGMTVAVGFPKNLVNKPGRTELFLETLKDNWILFLPLAVFIILFYLWYTRGRDPAGRGTIIAQFEAPDKLTPAEIGTIMDEKVQNKDITAEIINLAVRGYLKITRLEKDKLFFKSTDYLLEKLKEESDLENEYEKILLEGLFKKKNTKKSIKDIKEALEKIKKSGEENFVSKMLVNILEPAVSLSEREGQAGNEKDKKVVKLSDLANSFYKDLEKTKKELYKTVLHKGYFSKNPKKVRGLYITIGIIILFLSFFAAGIFGGLGVASFIISGLLTIIFGLFMPAKTRKGVLVKEHILGLKQYLSVAEKDRIEFHNAPEKNPKRFEKLLPYAMALGVEKEWAKQFKNIYDKQPDWYSGSGAASFNALALTHSLDDFSSSANTTLASKPSSASGGGSRFSGGGSGGGFGGGGGGSW